MVHMNPRTLALSLGGLAATALVGWLLVSGAKPPHAQSAAGAAPMTVGQGTQASPAPQLAVANAPSSTPTPAATTAAKQHQAKYAQNPQTKAKTRKAKRRAKVQRD
jgi:hypothetical protein